MFKACSEPRMTHLTSSSSDNCRNNCKKEGREEGEEVREGGERGEERRKWSRWKRSNPNQCSHVWIHMVANSADPPRFFLPRKNSEVSPVLSLPSKPPRSTLFSEVPEFSQRHNRWLTHLTTYWEEMLMADPSRMSLPSDHIYILIETLNALTERKRNG